MTATAFPAVLPLSPYERAMVYAIEHNAHYSHAQVMEYLHWAKARASAGDTPYQPSLESTAGEDALREILAAVAERLAKGQS